MDVTSDEFKDSVVPAVKRSLFTGLSIKCDGAKTIRGCLRSDDVCDQANSSGLCSISDNDCCSYCYKADRQIRCRTLT